MIIPGYTLRHARTVASCASSSVKSHVSSNKATQSKDRVVQTLLTSMFSCCNLDWGFRFWHFSSRFLEMARRTHRGTDFVGWESSTTQLKYPSGMLKDSHFLSRHESKGRNLVLQPLSAFINQLEAGLRPSVAPPPLEARCRVSVWTKKVFGLDWSYACGRKQCAIVPRCLWIPCHHGWGGMCCHRIPQVSHRSHYIAMLSLFWIAIGR